MKINFIYSPDVSIEQMIGYEMAASIWGQLFTDDVEVNILAKTSDQLNANVIGGAIPEFHEQHYGLFLQYFEADITSAEDQLAYNALQQGNTVDFLLNGDLVSGNTKLKLTTALAKALGMDEAISLDRYTLDESTHVFDGTIMMNQNFAWDFNYLRDSAAAENTLDFLSVALHETGHILGFVSSLDYSLQQETLHSGRTELGNFSPLDLFRFSAQSLALENPDGQVNDLSIGGTAWFSMDGGETLAAKMSTGKEGDGYQASHWERRYDPLGVMDPTLWYQERASVTDLDVLAFDVMGYDLAHNATDVEQLFTTEGLELALAQAKVNLANKLGVSVEWLENNSDVPVSSLDIIADMEAVTTETVSISETETDSASATATTPDVIKDLDHMMKDIYQWWSQGSGNKGSSWQELYEWWAQNSSKKGSSWQELYEWWAQGSGKKGSSWQELYEWWAQNSSKKGSSWQELYEWWAQGSGKKGSWWQEVFFASQDGQNNVVLEDIELPGQNENTVDAVYKEIAGGMEDDIIGGDISNDDIIGGAGDDLIDGAAGDDTILGGTGYDTIFGFDGNDSIEGGEGDDVISGESDNDALFGQAGADVLMGGEQDDYIDGGTGRDFLNGNMGDDVLIGGEGDDALEGEAGKDLLVGGTGQDIGNGGSGNDFIFGDQYSESLKQAFGDNVSNLTTLFTPTTSETTVGNDTNTSSPDTNELVLAQDPIRLEAESFTWSGNYNSTSQSYASGQSLITNSTRNQWITGSETFIGATGVYDIVIGYHDIQIDNGEIQFQLNNTSVDTWNLSQNIYSSDLEAGNFTTHTISDISLTTNDSFSLKSWVNEAGYGEGALDYIEFIPVEIDNSNNSDSTSDNENSTDINVTDNNDSNSSNSVELPSGLSLGNSSDILRGGHGNDGIDGGEGNDIIFGEDELNDSSNVAPVNILDTFNYGHSTYLLSQAATWTEAQAEAQSYGGNLVTINDAAEEAWLKSTFGNSERFWLGMNDVETEGEMQWISGEAVTYTNWASGEPNNWGDGEDYGVTNYGSQWNDDDYSTPYRGIIEIDWSSVGGNDTIFGGGGDDQIYGNSGNDLLYGDTTGSATSGTLTFQQGINGYNGTVDTQIAEKDANIDYSNGTELILDGGSDVHQVLIRFEDIFGSQADRITSDHTINSASLEINVTDRGNPIEVYEVLKNWSDTDTWNSWNNGIQTDGVEASSTQVTNITSDLEKGIFTIDITDSLQNWQANPDSNYGLALFLDHSNNIKFDSSEGSVKPRLVVDVEAQAQAPGQGNDNLTGNGGNDTLAGGAGNDIINGTDEIVAGYLELDVVTGGAGSDKFILGDADQAYYATAGNQDYAVIKDFDSSLDILQLHGSAGDYQQQQQGNDIFLSRNGDLVAILKNTINLNPSSSSFEYVTAI